MGSLITACTPYNEVVSEPAVSPAWAEVTAVQFDDGPRTTAKHGFAGNLELPHAEAGDFMHFYTPVVVAPTGVYAGGKILLRLDDGHLPGDVTFTFNDGRIKSLDLALDALFGDTYRMHRAAIFADRRLRFATFWPIFRTIEAAAEGWGSEIAVQRAEDPDGTTQIGLGVYSVTRWDEKERYAGSGAEIPDDPLTQIQLAVVLGPQLIEVGRLLASGEVQPLETINVADGLAPVLQLAERLYTTRDPNAYGTAVALVWAHDDAPLEQVLELVAAFLGPKCRPRERHREGSACWFDVGMKGTRASLAGLRLDSW